MSEQAIVALGSIAAIVAINATAIWAVMVWDKRRR